MNKEKAKKALKITGRVLGAILIAVEVLLIIFLVVSKAQGGPPTLFGRQMYFIRSGSMSTYLEVGDVIICEKYDGGELLAGKDNGDIVTYMGEVGGKPELITHRVISVSGDTVITKGDANDVADAPITKDEIVAVMVYKTVVIDKIYAVISTTWGFWLLIFTPIALLIVSEIISLVKEIKKEKEGADDENESQNE